MKKRANPLFLESLRCIWQTRTRFLSLMTIVALGCCFFAGLKASSPDMKLTADNYFADSNLMDLHLMSTFGFNDNDIEAVSEAEGIRGMSVGYSADFLLSQGDTMNTVMKVYSLPENREESDPNYLNQPLLLEGKLPEASGECAIDKYYAESAGIQVGDTITLVSGSIDAEVSDTLKNSQYTVVGMVQYPLYIGFNRGHSTIGDGEIDAFMLVPETDFVLDVYTDVYLTFTDTEGLSAYSDEYEDLIAEKTDELEEIASVRGQARYDEICEEAQAEIDDAKQELAEGEAERDKELADAEKKIADAEEELKNGRAEYEEGLATYNTEIRDAEETLADGEQQLADGENAYEDALAEYEQGRKDYDAALPEAEKQLEEYRAQLQELNAEAGPAIAQIDAARSELNGISALISKYAEKSVENTSALTNEEQTVLANADSVLALLPEGTLPGSTSLSGLLSQYVTAELSRKENLASRITAITDPVSQALDTQDAALAEARTAIEQLTTGIAEGEKKLSDGKAELDAAEQQLAETRTMLDEKDQELSDGWRELAKQKRDGAAELEEARIELENGEQELADAKAEYESNKESSGQEIEDAKAEIAKAEQDLADLKEPTWYVWDRNNNPDYSSYEEDSLKVDAVSAVFPVFFILVAALVCLTTMTRMVEEQRTQIGTLKALGYQRGAIMGKFLAYAALASVLGSVIGLAVGFKLFPMIIINAYRIMYELPNPVVPVYWGLALGCVAVSVLCMVITTFFAASHQTAEVPSQLMRPKAPKAGKRVLLERVGFIWKRLNFSQKVTVRNIFRYKRRFLMTLVGISGCTALMLTGFGLKYAITSIGDKQYEKVFVYDTTISLDDNLSSAELAEITEDAAKVNGVEELLPVCSRSIDVQTSANIQSITLMVPENPDELSHFIDLHERISGDALILSDQGVIINEKLSELLEAGVGDTITLVNPNGRPVPVTVEGIAENYALNYVYMTPKLYQAEFREEPVYSMLLTNNADGTDESALSEAFLDLSDGVLGVTHTSSIADSFEDMLGSLNNIVWVIIISAGLLAIVVLYNLANINVNERLRELATIKVLGFFDREVTSYITRENTISSIIGLLIGLVLGIALEKFVVKTAEVDLVMFAPDISWDCFVFAGLLTFLFTMLVNVILHFQLKKIDMVESLKSVE